jgi:hypothetical protein
VELDLEDNRYFFVDSESDPVVSACPPHHLRDISLTTGPVVPTPAAVARFARAAMIAARLRGKPVRQQLAYCVARVLISPSCSLAPVDVRRHISNYQVLRALTVRQASCLEDAVRAFLYCNAVSGIRADIVLGVETLPRFSAHAWVETSGGYLVNDMRARVEPYREILRLTPQ